LNYKLIVLMIFGLLVATTLSAQTYHSGHLTSDEIWDSDDNPHVITNYFWVDNGVTLTIESGCNVYFNGNHGITVWGILHANGVNFSFTGATPGNDHWSSIQFEDPDGNCTFSNCTVNAGGGYGGYYDYGAIYLINTGTKVNLDNVTVTNSNDHGIQVIGNSNPNISNCTISGNNYDGIYFTVSSSSNPRVTDCTISNNGGYAIVAPANLLGNISGNMVISGNGHDAFKSEGGDIKTGTWYDYDIPFIINGNSTVINGHTLTIEAGCEIRFNESRWLRMWGGLIANGTSGEHIVFTSNLATPSAGDWGKLFFEDPELSSLSYCDISYSGKYDNLYNDGSIYLEGSGSNLDISNCTITYSQTIGINLNYSSYPTIDNCIFDHCSYGIYSSGNSGHPTITNCSFQSINNYPIVTFGDFVDDIAESNSFSTRNSKGIYVKDDVINTGTWRNFNIPYIVAGSQSVNNNHTLTIEEGCVLEFQVGHNYKFEVWGALIANGSDGNEIVFTSNADTPANGDWNSLYFNDPDTTCTLYYCDILYAGNGDGALILKNTHDYMNVTNCRIEYSDTRGIYLQGSSSPQISGCEINFNGGNGIDNSSGSSYPRISYNEISYNGSYPIAVYGENVDKILENTISGNSNPYIYVRGDNLHTGIWRHFTQPYIISGTISVRDDDTLTIASGTELRFTENSTFNVYGSLIADGTETEHIVFTSHESIQSPGDWKELKMDTPDDTCILDYCDIFYSGGQGDGAIVLNNCYDFLSISNCHIQYSEFDGIHIDSNSSPEISNCFISDNNSEGILISSSSSSPQLVNCIIGSVNSYGISCRADHVFNFSSSNTIANGIRIYGSTIHTGNWPNFGSEYFIDGNLTVDNSQMFTIEPGCTVKFDSGHLIVILGSMIADGTASLPITFTSASTTPSPGDWGHLYFAETDGACLMDHCSFSYGGASNQGNITLRNTNDHLTFTNCTFTNSNFAGLYLEENNDPTIINCLIENNPVGIYLENGNSFQMGTNLSEWNDILSSSNYNIENHAGGVEAEYVYWGTTDQIQISNKLYGSVDFEPWTDATHIYLYYLTVPTPQNVQITINGSNVEITWDAVTGATSYQIYSYSNPYEEPQNWTLEESGITDTTWTETATGEKKFYFVKAVN